MSPTITAPDVNVTEATGQFQGAPTPPTGTIAIISPANRGPLEPTKVTSIGQAVGTTSAIYGPKLSSSYLADELDVAFHAGAGQVLVIRDCAADAVTATKSLNNSGATVAAVGTATSPGAWANGLTVTTTGAGPFTYTLKEGTTVLESYSGLASVAALIAATATSKYMRWAVGGGGGLPAAVTDSTITTGSDGSATNTASLQAALARLTAKYGVCMIRTPGYTASASHNAVADHIAASTVRRRAIVDPRYSTASTHATNLANAVADGTALQAHAAGKSCEMAYPWALAPDDTGKPKLVPPGGILAGLYAAMDRGAPQGTPLTGADAQVPWLSGLPDEVEEPSERDSLDGAGITCLRLRPGLNGYPTVTVYGDRAVTTSKPGELYRNASDDRLLQAANYYLGVAAEPFRGKKIDAQGDNRAGLTAALLGVGARFWEGRLLGTPATETRPAMTFADAWVVSVVGDVSAQAWVATVAVTIARTGERVTITLRNQPTAG